jgi:hypothetical protein
MSPLEGGAGWWRPALASLARDLAGFDPDISAMLQDIDRRSRRAP